MNPLVTPFLSLVLFGPAAATATAIALRGLDPTVSPTAAVSQTTIPIDRYQGYCVSGLDSYIGDYETHADCFKACFAEYGTALHATDWWPKNYNACYCQDSCDYWNGACDAGVETAVVPGKTVPEHPCPFVRHRGGCRVASDSYAHQSIGLYETLGACFQACSEKLGTTLGTATLAKGLGGGCVCLESCDYWTDECFSQVETAVVLEKNVPEHPGCDPCLVCPGGLTVGEDSVIPNLGELTCGWAVGSAKNTNKDSLYCASYKSRAEFHCCPDQATTATPTPSVAPSLSPSFDPVQATDSPMKNPSAAPSTTIATSIEGSWTQTLEIEKGKKFGTTEANTYEIIMENYTVHFGEMVGDPQIVTTCNVTGQAAGTPREAAGGEGERGLQTDLPVSYLMAINFTIRYESRYGYDVDNYPQQFQDYINSNLQQVADDMSWVIEAKEVTLFEAVGGTGTQTGPPTGQSTSSSITKEPTISPAFPSAAPTEQSPATPPYRENPALIGLTIALPVGALISALLIYYTRQRMNLRTEAREGSTQEEDEDVQGSPAAPTFDFVFSNKTESDALCLEVRDKLISRGVTVWQQRTNIPKDTDSWFNEWFPSAVNARKIVCFLTVQYLKSPYCMREFRIALNSNRLLIVACEPLNKIAEVDPSEYPDAVDALAYLMNGGQVIFHDSEDAVAEILKFADSTNDEESGAHPNLSLVDKAHLMNCGQVLFHTSEDMVAKNLGGSSLTEEFDIVFSNKTEWDALCLEVRDKLMSHGVTVWQQKTSIPKDSDNWFDEWFHSARKARKIVCFLTADYIKSPYCMKEFRIALKTNTLLAIACDPLAKINEVDPSAYPEASSALAYLMNGGKVIINDSEDVVAEILKSAKNPGEGNPNDTEAKA